MNISVVTSDSAPHNNPTTYVVKVLLCPAYNKNCINCKNEAQET